MGLGLKCWTVRAQNSPNGAGPVVQMARLVRSEEGHGTAPRSPQTRQSSAAAAPPNSTSADSGPRCRSACQGSPAPCLPAFNALRTRIRRPPLDRSGPFFGVFVTPWLGYRDGSTARTTIAGAHSHETFGLCCRRSKRDRLLPSARAHHQHAAVCGHALDQQDADHGQWAAVAAHVAAGAAAEASSTAVAGKILHQIGHLRASRKR
jgi:hypothetical protein